MSLLADPAAGPEAPALDDSGAFGRRVPWAFVLLSVMGVAPLWVADYPPMVDLPQHGGQIAIWSQWGEVALADSGTPYSEIYRVNPTVPHLLPHAIGAILASVLPVPLALKLILSAAIAATPFAALALRREAAGGSHPAGDRWTLASLPAIYGFAFYWGFFNFLVALPIALWVLGLAFRYLRAPSVGTGAWLAIGLNALFLCHLLVYGYVALVAALLLVAVVASAARPDRPGSNRRRSNRLHWTRLWPLLAASPLLIVWLLSSAVGPERSDLPVAGFWGLGMQRILELPGAVVGDPGGPVASLFVLTLVGVLWAGARPAPDRLRLIPLAAALGLFLLAPSVVMGTALVSPRFAFFVLPALVVALDPASDRARLSRWSSSASLALVALWIAILIARFSAYDDELGDLRSVLERAEPGRRMLYLAFDIESEHVSQPVFLHLGSWYQAERRGIADFSFSTFFANRFRYRDDFRDRLYRGFEGSPELFYWPRDGGDLYDLFLVRSVEPFEADFFERAGAPGPLEEVVAAGPYRLYRVSR